MSDPAKPSNLSARSDAALEEDIARLRGELAKTLDALEYQLDVPARFADRVDGMVSRARKAWDDRPLVVAAFAAGAVCAVASVVVGAVVLSRRASGH